MRDGPLNNWMGWAVSTVEAEAFKALAIVKENPPSTLCSMAVIYARASKRVPYGSQHWMHKAMSGLAEHTLETAAKRASYSCGWSDGSGSAIIQLCILNTQTNGDESALCTERKYAKNTLMWAESDQFANDVSQRAHSNTEQLQDWQRANQSEGNTPCDFTLCTV